MERLTEVENGTAMVKGCGSNCKYGFEYCRKEDWENCKTIDDVIDKLAEYEDLEDLIGIPMKDLAEILRQNIPEDCKHPHKAVVLTDNDVDRWNGYKNAEEQGLLLRLPCHIGDSIYSVVEDGLTIIELKFSLDFYVRRKNDFGKTVFLTKAEAEQKLKELRGKQNGKID